MSFHHPQTPQSPSQSSPTTSDPMTSQTSIPSVTVTLPTPAHSVNGTLNSHDMSQDAAMADDASHKRKRPMDDDMGEREQKKVHIEDRRLGMIEDLHLDVGEKYLLCQAPHGIAYPRISDDLFELFGLTDLAAEFARVLPNGEKNAIRKTYKGHIKRLGVNGHFDSVKAEDKGDTFLAMMGVPDEEWNIHFVRNRELENGFSAETRAKLPKAMSMAKGSVPKHIWDSAVLGELGPASLAKPEKQTSSAKATAPNTPIPPQVAGSGAAAGSAAAAAANRPKPQQAQQPLAREATRPKRTGKKRSYGDSSFEGYGDGFPDDDQGLETGYSTGEGESGGGSIKRRKKNPGNTQQQQYPQIRQAYGPGMVGA